MEVKVLGCSGGIGGPGLRTTSLLVDDDILIDAGTGVGDLTLDELARIDHVFLTHSHLDHIAALPLLVDAVADRREAPITVYSSQATLKVLGNHIFNWDVWPDFSAISRGGRALMAYRPIAVGEKLSFGARTIAAVPAEHTVPAVGYHLDSGFGSLVFTGDTTQDEALWPVVNAIDNLRYLVIEAAFTDSEEDRALVSQHLCPGLLAGELERLERDAEVYVSHMKAGQGDLIMREIEARVGRRVVRLVQGQVFEF
jgi:ribonuclease BN (tRNA processing enzyme)